jgi:glycosyltransferase involved in cell wall biosynthesis
MIEKLQYRVADRIGVESPSSLKYFKRFPALEAKAEVLWNWVADSARLPSQPKVRERLGLVGKTVFFYGGNMGVAQRMDRLLRLAEALHENRAVHFVLVGEGSERERLRADATRMGLTNFLVLDAVSQDEFMSMLAEFDIGVVLLDPQLSTHNVPGKLLSYAAAGKPTIAEVNAGNDLIGLLRTYRAGLASANDESTFILNAKLLANNADLRAELGINSRTLARELFSVKTAAQQIAALGLPQEP